MNPVNATALYVSACRSVLQCDPQKQQSFAEMYKLLPFFRQSLSCLVCGNLLQDPVAPTSSSCQHYVCRGCKGQKMLLKPSCSWCKDYSCFQENRQLSLLVDCYRQLCLYITRPPLLQRISSQVGGSPEVMTLLEEMLVSKEEEEEEKEEESSPAPEERKPPPPSAPAALVAPPPPAEPGPAPSCLNGPLGCNGAWGEEPAPSSPELEVCDPEETVAPQPPAAEEPDPGPAAGPPHALAQGATFSFREEGVASREAEEGEVLLLSVEEVLQTLETPPPSAGAHTHPDRTHTYSHTPADRTHARTHAPPDRTLGHAHTHPNRTHAHARLQPDRPPHAHAPPERTQAVARHPAPPPGRPSRKRSHSESDRERVQPLPISCILQGPPAPSPPPPPRAQPPAPSLAASAPPAHAYSALSNGGPPSPPRPPPRPPPASSKAARKHSDQGSKRPHPKPRAGGPKAKERSRDQRLLPPSPAKPLYKKPAEKKGCKCGRATQNPSVLTCRGQRCPCYSNRKACLDCICRGCQNSYMANGEKKLEAFAVPEKALEQTRLTLGINLTSIAAAHLRGPPPGAVHAGALINMAAATGAPVVGAAAFLSAPSPPPGPAYEDTLDLGFHC